MGVVIFCWLCGSGSVQLGPKLKGIVSQSVKEVLQSLVDDGLVQGDKIGSSNCTFYVHRYGEYAMNRHYHSLLEFSVPTRGNRTLPVAYFGVG